MYSDGSFSTAQTHGAPVTVRPFYELTVGGNSINALSAVYLLRNDAVLPVGAVVTGVTINGQYIAATGQQNLAHTRIRLMPEVVEMVEYLNVQRSNGTSHQILTRYTSPNLPSLNVIIHYQPAP